MRDDEREMALSLVRDADDSIETLRNEDVLPPAAARLAEIAALALSNLRDAIASAEVRS